MIRFSVIVPFLNEAVYLRACIDCLLNQTINKEEYQLIFIDNGSTDHSAEIVKSYPQIVYLAEEIKDPYIARNKGIQVATGDIIVFIDADCIVSTNLLEEYDKAFQEENVGIACGRISFPEKTSWLVKRYEDYYASKMQILISKLPRESWYAHAGNMAIRSEIFKKIGLFTPMPIVGDAEIVQRYIKNYPNGHMSYLDEIVAIHLEVDSAFKLLGKLYDNGIYSASLSSSSDFRIASRDEKFRTLSDCINRNKYSAFKQLQAVFALVIFYFAYIVGYYRTILLRGK